MNRITLTLKRPFIWLSRFAIVAAMGYIRLLLSI